MTTILSILGDARFEALCGAQRIGSYTVTGEIERAIFKMPNSDRLMIGRVLDRYLVTLTNAQNGDDIDSMMCFEGSLVETVSKLTGMILPA